MSGPTEYDCVECGRHIVALAGDLDPTARQHLCAACVMLPGWIHDPGLCQILDPEHSRNPPAHEKATS
jgi:DNA-directed RNA polymerase subunit RPC12/RpoP